MKKLLFTLISLVLASAPGLAQQPKLTIYTYESFVSEWGPGPKIEAAFEATCGCEIEWVGIADGVALLNRLKLEGKGTKADIVLGLDTNLTAEAAATGLFAPHEQVGTPLTVPVTWSDPIFLPYDYGYFAVVYDTQALKDPPKSLADLVDGDPKQKIVIEDPRSSTPGLGLLLWMKSVYGDKASEAWTKLRPRILTVTPGWSAAYGLFTKGEAPMVLSYTTSPAYHMVAENSDRYQAASFSEGHYLQIEVAGRIADSPNGELAKKFMAFMLTPGFQDAIPENNWMFPAAATSKPLPEAFGKLVQPVKTLLFSPEEVAAKRREWMDEWLAAMAR